MAIIKVNSTFADGKVIASEDYVDSSKQDIESELNSHDANAVKHINNTERANWNAKETPTGAQAKADQAEQDAKDYADAGLADKVDKVSGKGLSTNDYTTVEKNKLSGIATGANNYTHPSSHPASMITESSTKRFVSDSEKSTWNSKSDTDTVTTINGKTGAISKADIVALGIPASNTNTTYSAGAGLTLSGTVFTPTFGTTSGTVTQGNDSRLSNARTPLTHNMSSHSDINQSLLTTNTVQFAKIGVGTASPNESVDIVGNARVRSEGSMKFGGTGASDSAFEIKYNNSTKSLDFNFLL